MNRHKWHMDDEKVKTTRILDKIYENYYSLMGKCILWMKKKLWMNKNVVKIKEFEEFEEFEDFDEISWIF